MAFLPGSISGAYVSAEQIQIDTGDSLDSVSPTLATAIARF